MSVFVTTELDVGRPAALFWPDGSTERVKITGFIDRKDTSGNRVEMVKVHRPEYRRWDDEFAEVRKSWLVPVAEG